LLDTSPGLEPLCPQLPVR